MSEGTHSPASPGAESRKTKLMILLGGTVAVLVTAGVLFQTMRPGETNAAVEDPAGPQESGRARVDGQQSGLKDLASVNNQPITWQMVAHECLSRHGREVLDSMIDRLIVQQACQERGIVVTADEVDAEVFSIAKRFKLEPDHWYKMLEVERKISPDQYRKDVIWPMLALQKLAGQDVAVSEKDLEKAYLRDFGPKVKARMIMLDNQRHALKVWEKAVANPDEETFKQLVREESIEPNSRSLDGAVPPIRLHGGNDTLEKAAFKLKEGAISPIVEIASKQWVILRCEGRTEQLVGYEDVKQSLVEQVKQEKVQASVAQVFKKLKSQAKIHNFLTNTSQSGVKQATSRSRGRVQPASGTRTQRSATRAPARSKFPPRQPAPR